MENLNFNEFTLTPDTPDTQDLIEDDISTITEFSDKISENSTKKYKCKKCNQHFFNSLTLDIHIKTSLKCLRSGDSSSESSKKCQHCEKIFSSKQMRLYHETKCMVKIISDLKNEYNENISNLQKEIRGLKLIIEKSKE